MRPLFNSRQNASRLPALSALLATLFIIPVTGNGQADYTSFGAGRTTGAGGSDITGIVDQLAQSGLSILTGAVILMGIIWVCYVFKACARLNKPEGNTGNFPTIFLILLAGLSVFGSSCSVEQQVMATEYQASKEAEHQACPMLHHHADQANTPFNTRYPSNGYSNWYGPSSCKYCGQRIHNSRN